MGCLVASPLGPLTKRRERFECFDEPLPSAVGANLRNRASFEVMVDRIHNGS